jgi:cullin 3
MDDTWAQLSTNIREIFNQNAANLSFEENHRFGYNMVLHRHGERLYNGVKQLIVENLDNLSKEQIIPAFPTGSAQDTGRRSQEGEKLLKALRAVWDEHYSSLGKLRDILKYMVRNKPSIDHKFF